MSRWQKEALVLLLLTGAVACTVYPERQAKLFSDATGGESVERAFWQAVEKKDWKNLDPRLASNLVYVTPTGRVERGAAIERIHALDIKEYSLGDLTTEMNGQTFVVSYTVTLRGNDSGQALPETPQRRVSVWQKQGAGWVLISQTVVGTPAAN
jgi:ketosteroid isomerase-like protein